MIIRFRRVPEIMPPVVAKTLILRANQQPAHMLNRNDVPFGLAIGLLLPLGAFTLLYLAFHLLGLAGAASTEGFSPMFRERTASIVSICLNLIPLNAFMKRRATNSMRGIVVATTILVAVWVAYFGYYIF
jgi:hypothetical protein